MTLLWGIQMNVPLDNILEFGVRTASVLLDVQWRDRHTSGLYWEPLSFPQVLSNQQRLPDTSQNKTRSVSLWNRLARLHSKRFHRDE